MGRRFTVTIWGLPWTAVLQIAVRIPKKYTRKRERNAYRDGVAEGVAKTLNGLEVKPDPDLYGDRA